MMMIDGLRCMKIIGRVMVFSNWNVIVAMSGQSCIPTRLGFVRLF